MKQQSDFNHYFIPFEHYDENKRLIILLDCTGSMTPYFPIIASCYNSFVENISTCTLILFDRTVRVSEKKQILDLRIFDNDHSTCLTTPFIALNEEINKLQIEEKLTILFISDGLGEYSEEQIRKNYLQRENCNFICMGVGKQFPPLIASSLRGLYHTGLTVIPTILIVDLDNFSLKKNIEENLKHLFELEFDQVKYFLQLGKGFITNSCYQFPWETLKLAKVWSGSWVCNQEQYLSYQDFILDPTKPSQKMLISLGMYWLQSIKQLSLKKQVVEIAELAIKELIRLERLIPSNTEKLPNTFAKRVNLAQELSFENIITLLKQFLNGYSLNYLNDKDSVDRIKIGTVVGKFHQNALQFAGLSIENFNQAKNEFIECLKNLHFENNDDDDRSLITLQSQKDVLQEQDLIIGLQNCFSQYALVSTFPIIGYGGYVVRTNVSRIDPFSIRFISIAKEHTFLDSVSLVGKENHQYIFKTGEKKEKVNCILPLINDKNKDIVEFYRSQMFHIIMTFIVCENVDVCFEHSYAALLANALIYLLKQSPSQWRNNLIKLINYSYIQIYEKKHTIFNKLLIQDPDYAICLGHQKRLIKSHSLHQCVLSLSALKIHIQKDALKKIVQLLIKQYLKKYLEEVPLHKFINLFFNINYQTYILNKRSKEVMDIFNYCYSATIESNEEISIIFSYIIGNCFENYQWQLKFQLNEKYYDQEIGKSRRNFINDLYEYFMDEKINEGFLINCLLNAGYSRFQFFKAKNQNQFKPDLQKIKKKCFKLKINQLKDELALMCVKIFQRLNQEQKQVIPSIYELDQ